MEIKYKSHAEDFGWPPKKADKTLNADSKHQAGSNVVALFGDVEMTPVLQGTVAA